MSVKSIDTLIPDIKELIANGIELSDEYAQAFSNEVAALVKRRVSAGNDTWPYRTRMSNLGAPDYQHWYGARGYPREPMADNMPIKFLYGDILESMLLHLARWAGHTVEGEQRRVSLDNVRGSIDAIIDGVPVDVKSASSFAFKKFVDGTYLDGGGFGQRYAYQLAGYVEALEEELGERINQGCAFLAIDKVTGEMTLMKVARDSLPNAKERIAHVKKVVESDTPPAPSYEPVPDGKSGNMKLPVEGIYCPYKFILFPHLREFKYSNGSKYLTKIGRLPDVTEITETKAYIQEALEQFESKASGKDDEGIEV